MLFAIGELAHDYLQSYCYAFFATEGELPSTKATNEILQPKPSLLLLTDETYCDSVISGCDRDEPE